MNQENKKNKKQLSLRQKKLALLIEANLGNMAGGGVTLEELMVKAGYSSKTARKQNPAIVKPVREILKPLIKELDERIQWALNTITKEKLKKQSAYTNALTIDILVKNRRLITGKATGITELVSPGRLKELHAEVEKCLN